MIHNRAYVCTASRWSMLYLREARKEGGEDDQIELLSDGCHAPNEECELRDRLRHRLEDGLEHLCAGASRVGENDERGWRTVFGTGVLDNAHLAQVFVAGAEREANWLVRREEDRGNLDQDQKRDAERQRDDTPEVA